jgi:hypothetical protein
MIKKRKALICTDERKCKREPQRKHPSIILPDFSHSLQSVTRRKIEISQWVYERLCKIQAMRGVPMTVLADYPLVKFVLENWNLEEDRPKKEVEK